MRDLAEARSTVERIHLRYVEEVVEKLGFCPWARDARLAGHVRTQVSFGAELEVARVLALLDDIEAAPEIEVAFLVFPELSLDRLPFARFAAEVRAADAARKPLGGTVLATADFHPNAEADTSTPERLVPFVRRSPYPTMQAIRRSALDAVRMTENQGTGFVDVTKLGYDALLGTTQAPPLATRIARNNQRTVSTLGVPQLEAIFQDIARDRDASYAALGLALPTWADPLAK